MELFKLFGSIAIQNSDANDAIDDTTDKAEQSENRINSAFKKIGAAIATYFAVDKIKEFGLGCINAAADASAAESQFTQVFGDLEGEASKSLSNIAETAGITENRMKGSYTKIAAFAKTTGMETEDALSLADRAMIAVADSAAFYDRSLEETTESLQSFLKGNYENDAALGLSCTETTRNAAANELYGQSFKDLSESQKQLTLLKMVEDANELSGALGQAARESDTWTNQTGNLQQAWTDFQAALGNNVLPLAVNLVKKASEAVQGLTEKMPEIIQTFEEWSPLIAGVVTGFVTLKTAMTISSLINAVTSAWTTYKTANEGATIAQWLFIAALNANPIVLVVSLIAGLIAALVVLWNTNDGFREAVTKAWEAIKNTFSKVIEAIKGFFIDLVDKISSAWETIKETVTTVIETIKTVITEKFEAAKQTVINIFTTVKNTLSTIWETIKNVVQVAIMFIAELFTTAFDLITLPFQFIWENCKETIIVIWESIKTVVSTGIKFVQNIIITVLNGVKTRMSVIWNAIKETATAIWDGIKTFIEDVMSGIKNRITVIWNAIKSVIEAVLNGVKERVSTIWNAVKSITESVFSALQLFVSSVWNGIKNAIQTAINAAKSLVSDVWNSIKSKTTDTFNSLKTTVTNIWNGIKSAITTPVNAAKDFVKDAIDRMKGFFNFEWQLPKIKLPHFSISGNFSLDPPSIPTFDVSWYSKAMNEPYMFTKPTIFDVNPSTGQAKGAGEAGDELMIGKDTMLNMIRAAVAAENTALAERFERLLELLSEFFPQVLSMMNQTVVLDSGALVGELAPAIDTELGKISNHKGRGN